MKYHFTIQDKQYTVEIGAIENGSVMVSVDDEVFQVGVEHLDQFLPGLGAACPGPVSVAPRPVSARAAPAASVTAPASVTPAAGNGVVTAPIPGLIIAIKVQVGEAVTVGQTVATMEAMKMENNISSTVGGKVKEIHAAKGAAVAAGDVIMTIG